MVNDVGLLPPIGVAVTVTLSCALTLDGAWYITLVFVSATNAPAPRSFHVTPLREGSLESVAKIGNAFPGSNVWAEFGINSTEAVEAFPQPETVRAIRMHAGNAIRCSRLVDRDKFFIFIDSRMIPGLMAMSTKGIGVLKVSEPIFHSYRTHYAAWAILRTPLSGQYACRDISGHLMLWNK
jgi:hypothetical protein